MSDPIANDLLEGADEIAAELGWNRRKVYHVIEKKRGGWPIWKDGSQIYSSRSALKNYIANRVQAAMNKGEAA